MQWHGAVAKLAAGSLVFASLHCNAARATEPGDGQQYNVIAERNPFGLRKPVPQTPPAASPAEAIADLKLTGILRFSTNRVAYLVALDRLRSPRYLGLREGEEEGGIRVLAIHPATTTVEILQEGRHRMLSFEKHGIQDPIEVRNAEQRFVEEHVRAHEARYEAERRAEEARRKMLRRPLTSSNQ